MILLLYTSLPNYSRDQALLIRFCGVTSHCCLQKCKSPAEPLVIWRQTLASDSSAQTSPPGYLEITKCEIRIHKALVLIEHVYRIQNNTLYLQHIHAARTSTGLALQITTYSFIWIEITEMNGYWIEVSLHVSYMEHLDHFPCQMYLLLWCVSIERNMKVCQSLFIPRISLNSLCTSTARLNLFGPCASTVC